MTVTLPNSIQTIIIENSYVYSLIFAIETMLRELIVERLSLTEDGMKWFKRRVPQDIKTKSYELKNKEKGAKWLHTFSYHPIYYTDFTALQKLLTLSNNWRDAFQIVFDSQIILQGTLTELETIRNKVAHNRKVTPDEVRVVENTYLKFVKLIGPDHIEELLSRSARIKDIKEQLIQLRELFNSVYECYKNAQTIPSLGLWIEVERDWWLDDEYLGSSVNYIEKFFGIAKDYALLERHRGDGYLIEKWLDEMNVSSIYAFADNEFTSLLRES